MISRLALVGLSAALLAGPAGVLDASAQSAATPPVAAAPIATEPSAAAPSVRKRVRARTVRRKAAAEQVDAVAGETAPTEPDAVPARRSRLAQNWRGRSTLPPARPGVPEGAAVTASEPTAALAAAPAAPASLFGPAQPEPSTSWFSTLFGGPAAQERGSRLPPLAGRSQIDALITHHARLNGVPESLVHRIVVRESKYNPRAVGRGGAMGLMQIKTATARGQGYQGGPAGLLDAETNITYAVKYLAGAYRVADGNHDRAVGYYARGYYYDAKRKGHIETASRGERRSRRGTQQEAEATPQPAPAPATGLASFFSVASRTDDRPGR